MTQKLKIAKKDFPDHGKYFATPAFQINSIKNKARKGSKHILKSQLYIKDIIW